MAVTPKLSEVVDMLLNGTIATKRMMSARGPVDLVPMLHVITKDADVRTAVIEDRDLIEVAVVDMAKRDRLLFIGLCGDVVGSEYPEGTDMEAIRRGEQVAAFEAGDMTRHEAIVVSAIAVRTGELLGARSRYTVDDHGGLVFEETVIETEPSGQVTDNLQAVAARFRW